MSDLVIVTAMVLGTILILAIGFGFAAFRQDEKQKDGSYGLESAKNKAKADLVANDTILKLNAARKDPEYENVHVEPHRDSTP
jgi:hypothetical protein